MSKPVPRELRRAVAILKALGMALIYVPGDKWAIEQAGSPGLLADGRRVAARRGKMFYDL